MSDPKADLAQRSLTARKFRDGALVLPILGLFLFLTPIAGLFAVEGNGASVPPIFAYIYGVWFALILVSAWLAPRLSQDNLPEAPQQDQDG